ncbi:MAG: outer membrane lipoprotein-sorting protein [Ignavibacteria bacterium]
MRKLSIFLSLLLVFFTVSGVKSQTVDEVIDSHTKAIGGLDKLMAIKSVKFTGKFSGGGFEVPVVMTLKRKDMMRMDITFQGNAQITAFDGTTAWQVSPWSGKKDAEKLPKESEKEMRNQADIEGALVNYKDKGYKAELLGKEDMEGSEVYKIKLTDKDGDVTTYYLDTQSYLILKETSKRKIKEKEINAETLYGNYQQVEGITFPMSLEIKEAGSQETQKGVMEKVELNVSVDDSYFKMPEAGK